MLRRALPLVMAALLLLMLLSMTGHALHHMGHAHDCQSCPVCVVLCAWEKLMRRLRVAVLLVFLLAASLLAWRAWPALFLEPFLLSLTPVRLKVKLTN